MSESNLQQASMSGAKTEERKPVICPWCGSEMKLCSEDWDLDVMWSASYCCIKCKSTSPYVDCSTRENAEKFAYAAAVRKPPNLPLTQDQIEKMPRLSAVWVYFSKKYDPIIMSARDAHIGFRDDAIIKHTIGSLFFAQPPTQQDIDAALTAKGENQ